MNTLCQCLLLPMSTARAVLAGIRRIDRYKRSTGPRCLVREKRSELRPGRILNTFGEAVIMHHLVDRQVFHGDDIEAVDHATTLLMGKIGAPIGNPFMDTRHNRAPFSTLRCALAGSREFPLRALQVLFIDAQKLGAGRVFARREGREAEQPHVNPDGFARPWQGLGFDFTGNRHIPLARRTAPDGARFRRAFKWAVLDNPQCTNLGQLQHAIHKLTAIPILRKGHRIIPSMTTKTRIARCFACFATAEEGFERQVDAHRHILQYLRVHVLQRGACCFQQRQGALLLIVRQRFLAFLVDRFAFCQQVVIKPAAFFKLALQQMRLFFGGLESVFHRFRHIKIIAQKQEGNKPLLISPGLKAGGLQRIR